MKLFYLGSNIHQEALDIIEAATDTMLVYEDIDIGVVAPSIDTLAKAGRAFGINKNHVIQSVNDGLAYGADERGRIVSGVLNDYRVFLLKTRFTRVDHEGAFASFGYFSDIVDYALHFNAKFKPRLVYCSYTPHTVEAWIFMRTLEEAGVRIIRLITSPLPWVSLPVAGLAEGRIQPLSSAGTSHSPEKVGRYLEVLNGSYDKALPYYEKVMGAFSWGALKATLFLLAPKNALKAIEKRLVFGEYMKVAKPFDTESPFATYFLHYQPEMNTIPEAGLYCDQFQAIVKVASALPQGVKLIVKEHPSTFTKRCDRRWRPKGFYERIARIPNVLICAPGANAFHHIDRAKFVVSIAGVCLTEALARGITAVTFYSLRFTLFPSSLVVDASNASMSELREVLRNVCARQSRFPENEVAECLLRVAQNGYDGSDDESFIPRAIMQAAMNSKRANRIAIQDVIDGTLS
ncbi:MAG: hypothetical protein WC710_11915 [Gallionella sp.]|jgi:hypothetical protein